jgi:hypothetical protein
MKGWIREEAVKRREAGRKIFILLNPDRECVL